MTARLDRPGQLHAGAPVHVFTCYARDDRKYLEQFHTHVADLKRDDVEFFDDRNVELVLHN